MIVIESLS
jgi:hypothetical protein